VTYVWENNKIIVGQDWDLFSPVTSYTFDFVGLYFMAGNTGFMRQQFQYIKNYDKWEFGGALGMAGNNPGVSDSDLEISKSPSYALRVTYKINEKSRVGLSGIYASLDYEATNPTAAQLRHDAYAGNAFYEQVFSSFSLKSEIYYGQNLANIGALSIGKGTATYDVKEYGGMLTAYYQPGEKNVLFGGVGMAKVDNRSAIPKFSPNPATGVITAPGVHESFLTRLGWEHKITKDFSWISEVSRYETEFKLDDNKYQNYLAFGFETGVQLRF
jgi:hypothetical protein